MWTLCNGERDVGNDGETGEDARPALVISESGEDERNGGSTPRCVEWEHAEWWIGKGTYSSCHEGLCLGLHVFR